MKHFTSSFCKLVYISQHSTKQFDKIIFNKNSFVRKIKFLSNIQINHAKTKVDSPSNL
jgi:hypothetical protein